MEPPDSTSSSGNAQTLDPQLRSLPTQNLAYQHGADRVLEKLAGCGAGGAGEMSTNRPGLGAAGVPDVSTNPAMPVAFFPAAISLAVMLLNQPLLEATLDSYLENVKQEYFNIFPHEMAISFQRSAFGLCKKTRYNPSQLASSKISNIFG